MAAKSNASIDNPAPEDCKDCKYLRKKYCWHPALRVTNVEHTITNRPYFAHYNRLCELQCGPEGRYKDLEWK